MNDIPSIDLASYAVLARAGGIARSQPKGSWRERGATPTALHVGVGRVPPLKKPAHAIDEHGNTLWHYWAQGPHPERPWTSWLKVLDKAHAHGVNGRGEHPLHRLAVRGQTAALERWIKQFGWPEDLDPTQEGDRVLHRAAWSGNPATIQAVLKYDTHLDAQDLDGHSALTIALHRGGEVAMDPLLLAGADPNVKDARGRTAMHHAAEHGRPELLERIEAFGGDRDWPDAIRRTADDLLRQRMGLDARRATSTGRHWARLFEQRVSF